MVYDISYKTLFGSKSLRARFDKVDGFIGVHDVIRYLTLFDSKKYDAIYNIIRLVLHMFFLIIMQKSKYILMILYL